MHTAILTYARWIGIAVIGALIAVYAYQQFETYLTGPVISVTHPANGALVAEQLVEISGTAQNVSHLTLNGAQIYTDTAGHFTEQLLLPPGYTIMTLTARDRFGRSTSETIELVRH